MLESDPVGLNPVLLHLCQELGGHDLVLVLNVYLDEHYRFTFLGTVPTVHFLDMEPMTNIGANTKT